MQPLAQNEIDFVRRIAGAENGHPAEPLGLSPEMRQLFINVAKFDLDQLYEAIKTARQHGIYISVLIPSHGQPTIQVEG